MSNERPIMRSKNERNGTVDVYVGHITAIFSHDYPNYHHFEVLIGAKTTVDDKGEIRAIYCTRALVYLDSGCSKWYLVAEGEKSGYTPLKAMENFLGGTMVRFEEVIGKLLSYI